MLFKYIVLSSQHKMQKDRSISAVYYIMRGKQSIQTIQDAKLFQLSQYYGIYKHLTKQNFNEYVHTLEKEQYVIKLEVENYFLLTDKGKRWLDDHKRILNYLQVNGEKFSRIDQLYYSRLLLLIQVWTNSKQSHFTFIPIIENREVERWVKYFFRCTKNKIEEYLLQLYEELVELIGCLPDKDAELFVSQLTGYKTIGMTTEQLCHTFQISIEDVHMRTTNIVHFILSKVSNEQEKYPILYAMSEGLLEEKNITDSAIKTKNLLDEGLSISQIAKLRRLKVNTIYDHIVEIALYDEQFPLNSYVSECDQKQIVQAIEHLQTYKLKEIKRAIREDITYFQIRLVFTQLKFRVRGERTGK